MRTPEHFKGPEHQANRPDHLEFLVLGTAALLVGAVPAAMPLDPISSALAEMGKNTAIDQTRDTKRQNDPAVEIAIEALLS